MGYPSDADIIKLLHNDPLANAEKITNKSYKDDESTVNLGLMMSIHDNMVKDKALKAIGDTVFTMDWFAYCEMIETFGFGLMLNEASPDGDSFRIYYHEKDGILLSTDSFQGNRNSATAYYNWKPNTRPKEEWKDPNVGEFINFREFVSSGGFHHLHKDRIELPEDVTDETWKDVIWSGDHDAREALDFNMRMLRENGAFVPVWKKCPFLWLLGHWEKKATYDYDDIREARVKNLPEWVQENIKGDAR